MDKHDVSGSVTAEHIALLHQEDLKVQDHFGCRGLAYWYDSERKVAFCLVEAPNEQALKDMHDIAYGKLSHSIIEVDANIVESFLGRIEAMSVMDNSTLHLVEDPAFRTIMILLKVPLTGRQDQIGLFKNRLNNLYSSIRPLVENFKGRIVREDQEGYLISFQSASMAVDAALAIKTRIKQSRLKTIPLKIGISAGCPVTNKKSIFEDAINLAERICTIIPGDIVITKDVFALAVINEKRRIDILKNVIVTSHREELFVTQLMDFFNSVYKNSNLKVDDFCKPVALSKSQCYRNLKVLTGKSPQAFLRDFRLDKALKLLHEDVKNIAEIAFETGFTSPSYFSKIFKKKYGHTPSEYLSPRY